MEMQFSSGQEEMQWYEYWKATRMKWHLNLGTPQSKLGFHDHDNLAHYANATVDIQFDFHLVSENWKAFTVRTDFDLTEHQKLSGKKLQYFWSGAQRKLCALCSRDLNRLRPYVFGYDQPGFWRKGTRCGRQQVNQRSAKATSCIGSGESGGTSICLKQRRAHQRSRRCV